MAKPDDNIEGLRLIVVVSDEEFYYFPLPNSLQDLQKIEDYFSNRGQLEFICQQTSENYDFISLKSYQDYTTALSNCKTAQGLVMQIQVTQITYSQNKWACKRCMNLNSVGYKCSICGAPRPAEGVNKVFK